MSEKYRTGKVGGNLGPGVTNNPGWNSDLNYGNESRNDKATPAKTRIEEAKGKPEYKENNGFFEKRSENNKPSGRGSSFGPNK